MHCIFGIVRTLIVVIEWFSLSAIDRWGSYQRYLLVVGTIPMGLGASIFQTAKSLYIRGLLLWVVFQLYHPMITALSTSMGVFLPTSSKSLCSFCTQPSNTHGARGKHISFLEISLPLAPTPPYIGTMTYSIFAKLALLECESPVWVNNHQSHDYLRTGTPTFFRRCFSLCGFFHSVASLYSVLR